MTYEFSERDVTTVTNCLRVAAEQFNRHAATFRDTAKMESVKADKAFITTAAAERLAEQFDRQEREAYCLANRLDSAVYAVDRESAEDTYEIPNGVRLADRRFKNDHCGRGSCQRCYVPITERNAAGHYIIGGR